MRCSVGTAFEEIPNRYILPSEKIEAVRMFAAGKKIDPFERERIQSGMYLCTNCHKCTDVCPVGINLQQLWFNFREFLLQKGAPELHVLSCLSLYRGLNREKIEPEHYFKVQKLAHEAVSGKDEQVHDIGLNPLKIDSGKKQLRDIFNTNTTANTLWACYSCSTCSNSCPVVASYPEPQKVLGLLPHQIIQATKMGLSEPVFTSRMLRDCLWCYACQQNCPQNVQVTDILFELKNLAIRTSQNIAIKN
jgi:heterodisulfide reductase subunit C